jgi:hypothetical protein
MVKPDSYMCAVLLHAVGPQVVFKQTEYNNLAVGLFQSRAEMHRRVYTHTCVPVACVGICGHVWLSSEG